MRLCGISKSFGDRLVLENVTLTIPEKGITRITGGSGLGKTTLLSIIAGTLTPDAGERIGFENIRVSCVFQEDRLLPWYTARKNVALVSDSRRAAELLAAVGLAESEDKLPAQLSGGMRRRAALARALAYDGDLLLLDEPFSGVDEPTRREVLAPLVARFAESRPVLLVTHDAEDAEMLGIADEYAL